MEEGDRDPRESDLDGDRRRAFSSSTSGACSLVAHLAAIREYENIPAGRRPSSRRRRRRRFSAVEFSRRVLPFRARTVQVFMDSHSRIYWYRAYLRDTPARIVRPNNMPARCAGCAAYALPTMVSFVSTANIYDVTSWKIAPRAVRIFSPLSLCFSAVTAATENSPVYIRRSFIPLYIADPYLFSPLTTLHFDWERGVTTDTLVCSKPSATRNRLFSEAFVIFWCAVKLDWTENMKERASLLRNKSKLWTTK